MPELSLRERCEKRLVGLKAARQPYEQDWRDIARYAAPGRTRFLNEDTNKNWRKSPRIYDEYGIFAFRTQAGGMASGLSSESRPWFNLELYDADLMQDPDVRAWLDDTETRMYDFLAGTNFYSASKAGYSELGLFGTEACVMISDQRAGAVCHPLTVGEYWIGLSASLDPDTLYRRIAMTTAQAVERYGREVRPAVMNAYDNGRYEEIVNVVHAVELRRDRDPDKLDSRNMAWRSVYWDEQDDRRSVLKESGYSQQPFWAPRWDVVGADVYGMSPGMDALPSMRELQALAKNQGESFDWLLKPEKIVGPSVKLKNMPGSIVAAASVDTASAVVVPWQPPYQLAGLLGEAMQQRHQAIDRASYADLFMAITNMPGIQPRNIEEIASRNEEKLTQLGSVVGNVNKHKLSIALDITFSIMSEGGLLLPAPDALHGQEIKFGFISILTQMQRAIGLGQIERTAGFVGNLAAVFPESVDKLNTDEMIDEYAQRAGAPSQMIRTDEQVKAIRDSRAQAQQAEKAAAMMPAVQQGADAARLLSETDAGGGQSLLQNMMPA